MKVFRQGSDVIRVGFKNNDFGVTAICGLNVERPENAERMSIEMVTETRARVKAVAVEIEDESRLGGFKSRIERV